MRMKMFFAFFIVELKRFFSRKNVVVLVLFLALSLYFVQEGINEFKDIEEKKGKFQEIERMKVEQYTTYMQYGNYGFRLLFFPSPLSAFFANSGVASEITSQVDSGEILKIYNSYKGKNLFSEKNGSFQDFSGIILLFGSLLVLYFGFNSFRHRDYLKFLSGLSGHQLVFSNILISRSLALIFSFLFLVGMGWLLLVLNGIQLGGEGYVYLLKFIVVMLMVLLFFFMLGTVIGTLKSKSVAIVSIIVLWFVFVFLLPGIINKLVANRAENITLNYQLEMKKLKVLMDFERRALENKVRRRESGDYTPEEKKFIESYFENNFQEIEALERGMIVEMNDNVKFYHALSSIFPSTFYLSINNEVGSQGYRNFIDFYNNVHVLKRKFVRFYLDKEYFFHIKKPEDETKKPDIENFIKGDENIFYARSRMPYYLRTGIFFTVLFGLLLFVLSYFRFKKSLFRMIRPAASTFAKKFPKIDKFDLRIRKGESYVLLSANGSIEDQLYVIYSGALKKFEDREQLRKRLNILAEDEQEKADFAYIGKTGEWPPNMKVADFLTLVRRLCWLDKGESEEIVILMGVDTLEKEYFNVIEENEKRKVIFAAAKMKKSEIYIFDDFLNGMSVDFIIEFRKNVRKLKETGARILYLSNDVLLAPEIGDRIGIVKNGQLLFAIKDSDLRQMNLNEVYFQYFADKK